jgi:AraC-like DNA-binding protein
VPISIRYAIDDYAIDPITAASRLPDAFVRLSDDRHYRFGVSGSFGEGRHEFCGFRDGFYIIFSETKYHSPQSEFVRSPDTLQIFLASSGDGEYVAAGGEPVSFEGPISAVIIEPVGESLAELTLAGHARYLYLVIHRTALKSLYAGAEHELPSALQQFLGGDLPRTVGKSLQLSTAMLRCLEDVHGCPLKGHRRRLFLQSKAIEVVCQALEAFDQSEGLHSPETTRLTAKGVLKAQRVLTENFVTPPSLEALALDVGLSRSALCTGFRQILGQSVFDYVHDLRMQQALELLNERDASITQIAYAVGYNRASSFTVAVQRQFGTTPSELRRRGMTVRP